MKFDKHFIEVLLGVTKINKYIEHTKTVLKHKKIVFSLMWKCGYGWQRI